MAPFFSLRGVFSLLLCHVLLLNDDPTSYFQSSTQRSGLVAAQHLEQEAEFLFPPPQPNASVVNYTYGYNPWMPEYSGTPANGDPAAPTFVLMVGACLSEARGGRAAAQFYSDAVTAFWQQCSLLQMQCQCRPMVKPDRWNPPQPDRSIYNGMADTEWELHRLFQEHEQGLIRVGGITIKASFEAPYMFDKARSLGIPLFLLGVNEPRPGDREEHFVEPDGYIGTNNAFLGTTMARLVKQLRPNGGTFAFIMSWGSTYMIRVRQGFLAEMNRDDQSGQTYESQGAQWNEVDYPYNATPWVWSGWRNCPWTTCMMEPLANPASGINPTAIIFLFQNPVKEENYTFWVDAYRDQNITLIGFDALDYLEYLSRGYLDGLVGQVTYEMGTLAAQVMNEAHSKGLGDGEGQLRLPPNKLWESRLVAYNKIPLDLDVLHPIDFDQNLIGKMSILGFVAFGIVIVSALLCLTWTLYFRSTKVVNAAQPFFLIIVVVGVIILASAMIPLSFDDDGDPSSMNESFAIGICMSVPWLGFTGIAVIFAALFSKTWRINKLFNSQNSYVHVHVKKADVMVPFAVVFLCNVLILTIWTVLDPLKYERVVGEGTDFWNRNIESIGVCRSDNALAFLLPLAFTNFSMIVVATWQAFATRKIESEFAESKYILMTTASLFQAFLTGIPVAAVVKDDPQAYYLVTTLMIFLLSEVILTLIFVPKMRLERRYARMTEAEQKYAMLGAIRKGSGHDGGSSDMSSRNSSVPFYSAGRRTTHKFAERDIGVLEVGSSEITSVLEDRNAVVDSSIVTTTSAAESLEGYKATTVLTDDVSDEVVAKYLRARGLKRAAEEMETLIAAKKGPKSQLQSGTSELESILEDTEKHQEGPIHDTDQDGLLGPRESSEVPESESDLYNHERIVAATSTEKSEGVLASENEIVFDRESNMEDEEGMTAASTERSDAVPTSENEIIFDRESNMVEDQEGPLFQKFTPDEEDEDENPAAPTNTDVHET